MQQTKPLLFVGKTQNSTAEPLWYEMEVPAKFAEAHDEPFYLLRDGLSPNGQKSLKPLS